MLSGTVSGVGGTVLLTRNFACSTRCTIRLYSLLASSSSSACCAALSKAVERTSRAESSESAVIATTGPSRPAAMRPAGTGWRRTPAPESLHRHDGSRPDGLVAEEARDILRELKGAAIALARFLPEAFEADGLQVSRHVWLETGHRHGLVVKHLDNGRQRRLAGEGRPAGQQFVEDGSEGVDIRGRANRLGGERGLFGGHVAGCAQ